MPALYDAHNHLHDAWLAPHRASIFAALAAQGVRAAIVNGTCESDWPEVAALCAEATLHDPLSPPDAQPRPPIVLPSYGLHPWHVGNRTPDWQRHLLSFLALEPCGLSAPDVQLSPSYSQLSALNSQPASPRPFARLGEFGLDRWMLDRARPDDPRLAGLRRAPLEEQTEVFLWQFELAARHNLPASIHCIDAWGHLHDQLRTAKLPDRGFLLHAYSGPVEMVPLFTDLGAYFSFNGSYLEARKTRLRDLFATVPPDRLLVETDAPAMRLPATHERYPALPAPDGSLANHPGNLAATYAALAELRQLTLDSLAAQIEENFHRLFLP